MNDLRPSLVEDGESPIRMSRLSRMEPSHHRNKGRKEGRAGGLSFSTRGTPTQGNPTEMRRLVLRVQNRTRERETRMPSNGEAAGHRVGCERAQPLPQPLPRSPPGSGSWADPTEHGFAS
jgi:hypothetical protein